MITREAGALGEQVHIATRGQPIDVVADLVAGAMFGELINILRPEGRYTTAGAIGGPVVTLDLRTVYLKHLQLHGSSQGTRSAFRRLHRHIEEGRVKPLLWQTFPLSRIRRRRRRSWPSNSSASWSCNPTGCGRRSRAASLRSFEAALTGKC